MAPWLHDQDSDSRSEIMDEKSGARGGPIDHNYMKISERTRSSTPLKVQQGAIEKCNSCEKMFERQQKKIRCGFCESPYCNPCSNLTKSTFEALTGCENTSWYCGHCVHAVPGVQKLLIRVGNVEEKCNSLENRVENLESKAYVSSDVMKDFVHEEVLELKEIDSRKLNLICLNLPESKKIDTSARQQEDQDFLNNLLETKMKLDPDIIVVDKLVRLGRRDVSPNGSIKCRPLRLTVNLFDHKRQILKANSELRSCEDHIFSNIYFTPDLTKNQRKQAYELRLERRSREEKGETNLKISKGKIVRRVADKESVEIADRRAFHGGTASSSGPSISQA